MRLANREFDESYFTLLKTFTNRARRIGETDAHLYRYLKSFGNNRHRSGQDVFLVLIRTLAEKYYAQYG